MSVEVSLKFNALRSIDFIGNFCSRQIPLSPRAGKQIELNPLKSYDFKGFFFYNTLKQNIQSFVTDLRIKVLLEKKITQDFEK